MTRGVLMGTLIAIGTVGIILVGLYEIVFEGAIKQTEELRPKSVAGKVGNFFMTLAIIGFLGFMLWLTTFSGL